MDYEKRNICQHCGHPEYFWANFSYYKRKRNALLEFISNGWHTVVQKKCVKCLKEFGNKIEDKKIGE